MRYVVGIDTSGGGRVPILLWQLAAHDLKLDMQAKQYRLKAKRDKAPEERYKLLSRATYRNAAAAPRGHWHMIWAHSIYDNLVTCQ